ncbi:hypothetical protein BIT28_12055 [Photobacterium proteolyticum]|uniref:Uncharacterized protein n=1 Tax=Photobacterium proteolyticum TaxID=1903952 RepID=A0A1Q9GF97_9GAMM|nr:hypothetical protein [Photobacterium proteolyticum]OLQ73094.1 hypothetical protein BIT28_12055 [Photobacterium proteolyticum]
MSQLSHRNNQQHLKQWIGQYTQNYYSEITSSGSQWHWQLSIAKQSPCWLVSGSANNAAFEIHCDPQALLSFIKPAVTHDVFTALPTAFQMLLVQQACEVWFSATATATVTNPASVSVPAQSEPQSVIVETCLSLSGDTTDSLLCLSASLLNTDTSVNVQTSTAKFFFLPDEVNTNPLLTALFSGWPPRPITDHPQPPVRANLLAGYQWLTQHECEQLHAGAILCQGVYFYPQPLICIEGDNKTNNDRDYKGYLVSEQSGSSNIQVLDLSHLSLSPPEPDSYWLLMESASLLLTAKQAEGLTSETQGIPPFHGNHSRPKTVVDLYLVSGTNKQNCGQAEIVEYGGQLALQLIQWYPLARTTRS